MKLIFCNNCEDILSLRLDTNRSCTCGRSSGHYIDGLHAVVSGPCTVLGFDNKSLLRAKHNDNAIMSHETDTYRAIHVNSGGCRFEAFIIPEGAPTVKRIQQ